MILIDSNVLIDVFNRDPLWFEWSLSNLQRAVLDADLVVNAIVVGEAAPWVGSLDDFTAITSAMLIRLESLSAEAGYIAGEAYQRYLKQRKQLAQHTQPKSILADFFIGGHAQSAGATILTRDPRFYRQYFQSVPLITPGTDPA